MIMEPMAIDKIGSNPFMLGLFDDKFIDPIKAFVDHLHRQMPRPAFN
jgi:hypothetical protein